MLSGIGNPPERISRKERGDDGTDCNLPPGPDKFYLDGADMQTIQRDLSG